CLMYVVINACILRQRYIKTTTFLQNKRIFVPSCCLCVSFGKTKYAFIAVVLVLMWVLDKLLFVGDAAHKMLWGCPQLRKVWKAKHHPQKRHIPRQAGLAQTFV
ncbi:MAG: hypothetical protein KA783_05890, partial [Chitinophagales bacterium]|nr:hypothetical protein [Chitinophagales bacterium]